MSSEILTTRKPAKHLMRTMRFILIDRVRVAVVVASLKLPNAAIQVLRRSIFSASTDLSAR